MTTVGYGDITAVRVEEKIIACLVMVAGSSMFAYMMGSVVGVAGLVCQLAFEVMLCGRMAVYATMWGNVWGNGCVCHCGGGMWWPPCVDQDQPLAASPPPSPCFSAPALQATLIANSNELQARMTRRMLAIDRFVRTRRIPPALASKVSKRAH